MTDVKSTWLGKISKGGPEICDSSNLNFFFPNNENAQVKDVGRCHVVGPLGELAILLVVSCQLN